MTSLLTETIFDFIGGAGSTINSLFNNLFYFVFYIENQFNSFIDFNNIFRVIYFFAISILIMLFIKKMIETYFLWQSGDPDSTPFNLLMGFVKAIIIMLCFGYAYDLFVNVMADLNSKILASPIQIDIVSKLEGTSSGFFGAVASITFVIILLLIVFQLINRGIEMLIIRIAIPFACIGLLNSDGGVFPNYIKKFLQNAFSVIVQLSLVNMSMIIMDKGHLIYAICFAIMAIRSPHMIQELTISSSGLGVGASAGRIFERSMSRFIRKK